MRVVGNSKVGVKGWSPLIVGGEVVVMGPAYGINRLSESFLKHRSAPIRVVNPFRHFHDGICVHSGTTMIDGYESGFGCNRDSSDGQANGFLCKFHQIICEPINFNQRKDAHETYLAGRDHHVEVVDLVIRSERREIDRLMAIGKIVSPFRGFRVEAGRTLAPLPVGAFDGVWEHPPPDLHTTTTTNKADDKADEVLDDLMEAAS